MLALYDRRRVYNEEWLQVGSKDVHSEFSIVKRMVCDDKAEFKDFFFSYLDVVKRKEVALFAVMLWRI
ncbi:hypothetical protein Q3G72_005882 [Acer saccharum]|nr:hypothetical protein Q3G72_005882 [Acer saccharum]